MTSIGILIRPALAALAISQLATAQDKFTGAVVRIEQDSVLNDFSDKRAVGINLNFLMEPPNEALENAVADLGVQSLRWPMGTVATYYLFDKTNPENPVIVTTDPKYGKIPYRRHGAHPWPLNPQLTSRWKAKLGPDAFIALCRKTGAEPIVVAGASAALHYKGDFPVATRAQTIQAGADLVHYLNVNKKYGVKYFEIGNENDFEGFSPEEYGKWALEMAAAMKKIDPSISVGVNGGLTKEWEKWWDTLLPMVKGKAADFIVAHQYSGMKTYAQWRTNRWTYVTNVEKAAEKSIEHLGGKPVFVTEISSFNPGVQHYNNVWKGLHNFEILANALATPGVDSVQHWISRFYDEKPSNDFSAFAQDYRLRASGQTLRFLARHQRGTFVKITPQPTATLRCWASRNPETGAITVFLLNKDTKPASARLPDLKGTFQMDRLSGKKPSDLNLAAGKTENISAGENGIDLKLPPLSLTALSQ